MSPIKEQNLEVLDHLAEPDAAGVRADGDAHLGGHQVDGQHVVEAAAEKSAEVYYLRISQPHDKPHSGGVDLAELHGARLQELLEHHPVLAHLARGHADAWNGEARMMFNTG